MILATEGEAVSKLPMEAKFATAGLDNTQEIRLTAKNPLPEKAVDRSLPCVLGGNMQIMWGRLTASRTPTTTVSM